MRSNKLAKILLIIFLSSVLMSCKTANEVPDHQPCLIDFKLCKSLVIKNGVIIEDDCYCPSYKIVDKKRLLYDYDTPKLKKLTETLQGGYGLPNGQFEAIINWGRDELNPTQTIRQPMRPYSGSK